MILALPVFDQRISPVLDYSGSLTILTIINSRVTETRTISTNSDHAGKIVSILLEHDIDVVICGGVSQELVEQITSSGIILYNNVCGTIDEILTDYLSGRHDFSDHLLPGCRRHGKHQGNHRCYGNHGFYKHNKEN
jgi:predicted Fe-Mo cluster-binding NifX family protein